MIIVVTCIKDTAEVKSHAFPAFLFLRNLLYFLLYLVYLSFSEPYSSSVHILLHDHFLSTVLVGKEQMHPEGVIFHLRVWLIFFFFYLCICKTVAKF